MRYTLIPCAKISRIILLAFISSQILSCSKTELPPNILLILVDDMGYGDASCYNPASKIPTPAINKLAEEGMLFTDAHAPGPLCHYSRYGLMTGRYPFRTDVSVWRTRPTIEDEMTTLPSFLSSIGYHTAMVGKWHLGFLENGYNLPLRGGPADRGFDSFFGIRASTDIPPYFYIRDLEAVAAPTDSIEASYSEGWSPIQGAFWRSGGIAPGLELKDVLPKFTEEAVAIIKDHASESNKEKPFMLYLAYPAPHTPWLPDPEFKGISGAGMYGDFLSMVDANIQIVLDAFESAGMLDNTVVLFTSDNGPVWYEDDVVRFEHDASGGLRGMKGDAWEAGHRMPFIVRWPGHVSPGTTSDRLVCFTDVLSTVADITGISLPAGAGPDSYSFYGALTGNSGGINNRPPVVMQSANGSMLIRSGDWKYIDHLGSGGFSKPGRIDPDPDGPEGQLYNLKNDPAEINNMYTEKPQLVMELSEKLEEVLAGN